MNSKAFAIFVGAIMVLSAFASFVLRGTDESAIPVEQSAEDSLQAFGVKGSLVEWSFDGLPDVLEMAPNDTTMAFWIDANASDNLTSAARATLPQSIGLQYGGQLYSTRIERLAKIDFNGTWAELHWIKPYYIGSNSLVIPYESYLMYPTGPDYVTVLGRPALFGSQGSVERVLDVITGEESAQGLYILPGDDRSDLQVAALGRGGSAMPLGGEYREFFLGVKAGAGGYNLTALVAEPKGALGPRLQTLADAEGLSVSVDGSAVELSGSVPDERLQGVLMALLGP